jgi:hypothetical protein
MLNKLLVAFVLFGMIGALGHADAFEIGKAKLEVEPYVKGGTIAWDQHGGVGGHKFMMAAGVNANVKFGVPSLGSTINLEGWKVMEGLDSDKGIIPEKGYSFSWDVKYFLKLTDFFRFYPYAGIGYEKWQDRANPRDWESLRFYNWMAGIGAESEKVYIKAGITKPFSPATDSGLHPKPRYGFSSEIGVNIWKNFHAGLFYKYAAFQDPDAKMTQSGLLVAYRLIW